MPTATVRRYSSSGAPRLHRLPLEFRISLPPDASSCPLYLCSRVPPHYLPTHPSVPNTNIASLWLLGRSGDQQLVSPQSIQSPVPSSPPSPPPPVCLCQTCLFSYSPSASSAHVNVEISVVLVLGSLDSVPPSRPIEINLFSLEDYISFSLISYNTLPRNRNRAPISLLCR